MTLTFATMLNRPPVRVWTGFSELKVKVKPIGLDFGVTWKRETYPWWIELPIGPIGPIGGRWWDSCLCSCLALSGWLWAKCLWPTLLGSPSWFGFFPHLWTLFMNLCLNDGFWEDFLGWWSFLRSKPGFGLTMSIWRFGKTTVCGLVGRRCKTLGTISMHGLLIGIHWLLKYKWPLLGIASDFGPHFIKWKVNFKGDDTQDVITSPSTVFWKSFKANLFKSKTYVSRVVLLLRTIKSFLCGGLSKHENDNPKRTIKVTIASLNCI